MGSMEQKASGFKQEYQLLLYKAQRFLSSENFTWWRCVLTTRSLQLLKYFLESALNHFKQADCWSHIYKMTLFIKIAGVWGVFQSSSAFFTRPHTAGTISNSKLKSNLNLKVVRGVRGFFFFPAFVGQHCWHLTCQTSNSRIHMWEWASLCTFVWKWRVKITSCPKRLE